LMLLGSCAAWSVWALVSISSTEQSEVRTRKNSSGDLHIKTRQFADSYAAMLVLAETIGDRPGGWSETSHNRPSSSYIPAFAGHSINTRGAAR
jgi:hypothetical protein